VAGLDLLSGSGSSEVSALRFDMRYSVYKIIVMGIDARFVADLARASRLPSLPGFSKAESAVFNGAKIVLSSFRSPVRGGTAIAWGVNPRTESNKVHEPRQGRHSILERTFRIDLCRPCRGLIYTIDGST